MLIELIKNKAPEGRCKCNSGGFSEDIRGIDLCISIDNKIIAHYDNVQSEFALQFPFTLDWYNDINRLTTHSSLCDVCGQTPYRIINNPLKSLNLKQRPEHIQ